MPPPDVDVAGAASAADSDSRDQAAIVMLVTPATPAEAGQQQQQADDKLTEHTDSKQQQQPDHEQKEVDNTPAFASPHRPAPLPPSQFARPHSFPSEQWPTPPLAEITAPGGVAAVGAQLASMPGGSSERFARWVIGAATVLRYEGDTLNGLYHGQGRAEFKGGQTYEGAWHEGLMHGTGVYKWADGCEYTGEMCHQAVTGQGRMLWPDGATYTGEVLNGQRHGEGVFVDTSVPCMYEGSWRAGLRHGNGKLTYDDAGRHYYEGQWESGARHGYGLLRYASGNVYEGEWVWDRKFGQGTMHWFTRNQKYEGAWADDKPHGQGEYTWLDLPVPTAEQVQLMAQAATQPHFSRSNSSTGHGRGASFTPTPLSPAGLASSPTTAAASSAAASVVPSTTHFQHPNRYVGEWVAGVRQGVGALFYSNGSVYDGQWFADRKEGRGRFQFVNGREFRGQFKDDQMVDKQAQGQQQQQAEEKESKEAVVEQMQALTISPSPKSKTEGKKPVSPTAAGSRRKKAASSPFAAAATSSSSSSSSTASSDAMFDLPLSDLLESHAREELPAASASSSSSAKSRAKFIEQQRRDIANVLLRFNSELLDCYRFYSALPVDIAQPEFVQPVLPYTPATATASQQQQQQQAVGGVVGGPHRLNLAQLWVFWSDLGLELHPHFAHVDTTRSALDRLVLHRMRALLLHGGGQGSEETDAQVARLMLPLGTLATASGAPISSVHDPRMPLLHRDFLEGLVRVAAELYRVPAASAAADEEDTTTGEQAEQGEEEKEDAEDEVDGDEDADAAQPNLLFARALNNFNQILLSSGVPPPASPAAQPPPAAQPSASSESASTIASSAESPVAPPRPASSTPNLSLPLHQLAALQLSPSPVSAAGARAVSATPASASVMVATAGGATLHPFSPPNGGTTSLLGRTLASSQPLNFNDTMNITRSHSSSSSSPSTLAQRLKRFIIEFVLPHARTRSRHGSMPPQALALVQQQQQPSPLTPQPLYRLPAIVLLVKRYERDLYLRVFLPHSTLRATASNSSSSSAVAAVSAAKFLPPLQDRTMSLSALLLLLKASSSAAGPSGQAGVLTPYFTLYHCLDVLFGPADTRPARADAVLYAQLARELLFEEVLEALVRLALYRGRVLGDVAASLRAERQAVEDIARERRERVEAERQRIAAMEAAAIEAAMAAADAETDSGASSAHGGGGGRPSALGSKKSSVSGPSSSGPGSPSKSATNSKPTSASAGGKKTAPFASKGDSGAGAAPIDSKGKKAVGGGKAAAGAAGSMSPRASQKKLAGSASSKSVAAAAAAAKGKGASTKKGAASNKGKKGGAATATRPGSSTSATAGSASGVGGELNGSPQSSSRSGLLPVGTGVDGSSAGSLARHRRRDSASSQVGGASPLSSDEAAAAAAFSLADSGATGAWALPPAESERLCADTESFLCALLGRPAPEGLRTSFPAVLTEEDLQIENELEAAAAAAATTHATL